MAGEMALGDCLICGELVPGTNLVLCNGDGRDEPGLQARPISAGGAGSVFRVNQGGVLRALKILAPKSLRESPELRTIDLEEWTRYLRTFEHEIALLKEVSNAHIAAIVDHGIARFEGASYELPYYLMELVEGPELLPAVSAASMTAAQVLDLLDEVAGALSYLHSRSILHADIKSENIKVDLRGNQPRAVLLDLGVAKVVDQSPGAPVQGLTGDALTYFYSTRDITRPEYLDFFKRPIALSVVKNRLFPDHDLYSFGCLLARLLAADGMQPKLASYLGEAGLDVLRAIVKRLKGPVGAQYRSIDEARDALRRVRPEFVAPYGVPELGFTINPRRAIPLPGGRIFMSDRMLALVDDPLFQRLRRVKQLSFVYLIHPGARHSRLSFALRRFDVCRKAVSCLLEDPIFRLAASPGDVEGLLLFSLLSEVRHYPLAHVVEEYSSKVRATAIELRARKLESILSRAALLGSDRLDDSERELQEILFGAAQAFADAASRPFYEQVRSKFSKEGVERFEALVLRRLDSELDRALLGLFEGPIDLGKLAYLTLDGMMTGLAPGGPFDLEGLLCNFRFPATAQLKEAKPVAAIWNSGLAGAEAAILSRYWLIQQAYWTPGHRAAMAQISFLLSALFESGVVSPISLIRDNLFASHEHALAWLLEKTADHEAQLKEYFGGEFRSAPSGLVDGGRGLYRAIVTLSADDEEELKIITALRAGNSAELNALCRKIEAELAKEFGGRVLLVGEVLLDVPAERRDSKGRLWVYRPGGDQAPMDVFQSPLLHRMAGGLEMNARHARVFLSPQRFEDAKARGAIGRVRRAAKDALRLAANLPPKGPATDDGR